MELNVLVLGLVFFLSASTERNFGTVYGKILFNSSYLYPLEVGFINVLGSDVDSFMLLGGLVTLNLKTVNVAKKQVMLTA